MEIISLTNEPLTHIWLISGAWGIVAGALGILLMFRSSRRQPWWMVLAKGVALMALVTCIVKTGVNVDTSVVVTDNLVVTTRYRGSGVAFRTDSITRLEVTGGRLEISTDSGKTYYLSGPVDQIARTIAAKTDLRLAEGSRTLLWIPPGPTGNDATATPVPRGPATITLGTPHPVTDWMVAGFVGMCMMTLIAIVVRREVEKQSRPVWVALGLLVSAAATWWMGTSDRQLSVVITDQTITVTSLHSPDQVLETQHVTLIEQKWDGSKKQHQSLMISTDQGKGIALDGYHKDVADAIAPRAGLREVDDGDSMRWVR